MHAHHTFALHKCDLCAHEAELSRYGDLMLCRPCKRLTYQEQHELGQRHLFTQR